MVWYVHVHVTYVFFLVIWSLLYTVSIMLIIILLCRLLSVTLPWRKVTRSSTSAASQWQRRHTMRSSAWLEPAGKKIQGEWLSLPPSFFLSLSLSPSPSLPPSLLSLPLSLSSSFPLSSHTHSQTMLCCPCIYMYISYSYNSSIFCMLQWISVDC